MVRNARDSKVLAKYFSIPNERTGYFSIRPRGRKPTVKSIQRKLGKLIKFVNSIYVGSDCIEIVWADGYQDDERTYNIYYNSDYQWTGGKISSNDFYLDILDAAKGLIFNPVAAYQYDDDSRHLNASPVT